MTPTLVHSGALMRAALVAVAVVLLSAAPAAAIDTDGDGLRDFFETKWGVTDPALADSDGDGVVDSAEDPDRDRLGNLGEQRFGTDPGSRDTDGDGVADGHEDHDGDGISDALEQDKRPVPARLQPVLARAGSDWPADRWECQTGQGQSRVLTCTFGADGGDTSVALFGDSHATQWIPALDRAGLDEGWQIRQLTKASCPSIPVLTKGQYLRDRGRSCRRWRANVLDRLQADPPDLIVITNLDAYVLVDRTGRPIPAEQRRGRWRRALSKTLRSLPPSASVLVLADAPRNTIDPVACLRNHRSDMSACTSRRLAPRKRRYHSVEKAVAEAAGAEFRTLYGNICTYDPCPLVHGNTLIWRDRGHMTATFVRRLTPSVKAMIASVLPPPEAAAGTEAAVLGEPELVEGAELTGGAEPTDQAGSSEGAGPTEGAELVDPSEAIDSAQPIDPADL